MPSCFKCMVVDKSTEDVDPIGVCGICGSLACYNHGTRPLATRRFLCVYCLAKDMKDDATGMVRHDVYSGRDDDRGGDGAEAPPGGGGGGGGGLVLTHAAFEESVLTAHIAALSSAHRGEALTVIERILEYVRGFAARPGDQVEDLAVTSDKPTVAAVRAAGLRAAAEIKTAEASGRLDQALLADALGVAAWASDGEPGEEIAVDRIQLFPDMGLQFALRVWSREFARVTGA